MSVHNHHTEKLDQAIAAGLIAPSVKKMHLIRNAANAAYIPKRNERNTLPSKTVPDQTMSIQEIMRRYAQGLPMGGQRVPIYEEDLTDMPDLQHLDLAERQEIIEHYTQEQSDLVTKIKKNREKKYLPKSKEDTPTPPPTPPITK